MSSFSGSSSSLDTMFNRSNFSMLTTAAPSMTMTPISPVMSGKQTLSEQAFSKALAISLQPKIIVILVGLPALGKSTVCKQILQYLNQGGCHSQIYNTGDVRRIEHKKTNSFDSSDYFDPTNAQAAAQRDHFALMALDNLLLDLRLNRISCGFLDATNTTRGRRELLFNIIESSLTKVDKVILFDVQIDSQRLVNYNINGKAFNSDYKDKEYSYSISDFKKRTEHYHRAYQPITAEELAGYGGLLSEYFLLKNAGDEYKMVDMNTVAGQEEKSEDPATRLMKDFVCNYKQEHGKEYLDAVDSFYGQIEEEGN